MKSAIKLDLPLPKEQEKSKLVVQVRPIQVVLNLKLAEYLDCKAVCLQLKKCK